MILQLCTTITPFRYSSVVSSLMFSSPLCRKTSRPLPNNVCNPPHVPAPFPPYKQCLKKGSLSFLRGLDESPLFPFLFPLRLFSLHRAPPAFLPFHRDTIEGPSPFLLLPERSCFLPVYHPFSFFTPLHKPTMPFADLTSFPHSYPFERDSYELFPQGHVSRTFTVTLVFSTPFTKFPLFNFFPLFLKYLLFKSLDDSPPSPTISELDVTRLPPSFPYIYRINPFKRTRAYWVLFCHHTQDYVDMSFFFFVHPTWNFPSIYLPLPPSPLC